MNYLLLLKMQFEMSESSSPIQSPVLFPGADEGGVTTASLESKTRSQDTERQA